MKTPKSYFKLKRISEIIDQAKDEADNFTVKFTSTSACLEIAQEKIWFINSEASLRAIKLHNRIKKEIGDLHADVEQKADFYDFSGIKKPPKSCYSVDINSAYLSVLKNEGLIKHDTFTAIIKATSTPATKIDRLKAVGMFATSKIEMEFIGGEPEKIALKENPQNWVFWLCCQKTTEAMKKVREKMPGEYLAYWVDGIFLKDNPYKAQEILKELGFNSKIEKITELKKGKKSLTYKKDGVKKILFLPQKNDEFRTLKKSTNL